ncbi:protelomerase family protein [Vibrio scophthalmi]|uniref:protelomerase family protein n=1 Tax=Vibrio scophthalmi TaxID=45658 RepID=UPI0022847BAD|nr:protelomerase family protein [Vibrio scophthalmi]MCY9805509.1 protelomerase family protein [Vibrio scophthalmi]
MSANTVDPKSFNDSDNIDRRRRKFNFAEFIKKFLEEVRAIDLSDLPQGQKTAKHKRAAQKVITALYGKRVQNKAHSISLNMASSYLKDVRNAVSANGVKHHAFDDSIERMRNKYPLCAYMLHGWEDLSLDETRKTWKVLIEKLKLVTALEKNLKGITPETNRYASVINERIKTLPEWSNELETLKPLKASERAEKIKHLHEVINQVPDFYSQLAELKIDHEVMRHLRKDAFARDTGSAEKKRSLTEKKEAAIEIDYTKTMQALDLILSPSSADRWEAVAAGVALATGRRAIEVLFQGEFKKVDNHRLKFVGQAKKRGGMTDDEMIIYTLTDANKVLEAIHRLRMFPNILALNSLEPTRQYSVNQLVANRTARPLNEFVRDLFENVPITTDGNPIHREWLFKDTRAIYAKISFELFFKDDHRWKSKDENMFYKELLGHHDTDAQTHYMQFKVLNAGKKWEPLVVDSDKRRLEAVKAMSENEWIKGTSARIKLHEAVIAMLENDPYQVIKAIDIRRDHEGKTRNYKMVKDYLALMEDALKLDWSIDAIMDSKSDRTEKATEEAKAETTTADNTPEEVVENKPKDETVLKPKMKGHKEDDGTWLVDVTIEEESWQISVGKEPKNVMEAFRLAWNEFEHRKALPEKPPAPLVTKDGGMWYSRIMIKGQAICEVWTPSKKASKDSTLALYRDLKI